jgi:hypothetical protein
MNSLKALDASPCMSAQSGEQVYLRYYSGSYVAGSHRNAGSTRTRNPVPYPETVPVHLYRREYRILLPPDSPLAHHSNRLLLEHHDRWLPVQHPSTPIQTAVAPFAGQALAYGVFTGTSPCECLLRPVGYLRSLQALAPKRRLVDITEAAPAPRRGRIGVGG